MPEVPTRQHDSYLGTYGRRARSHKFLWVGGSCVHAREAGKRPAHEGGRGVGQATAEERFVDTSLNGSSTSSESLALLVECTPSGADLNRKISRLAERYEDLRDSLEGWSPRKLPSLIRSKRVSYRVT